MTLPLNFEAFTFEPIAPPFGSTVNRSPSPAILGHSDFHDNFAERTGELQNVLQEVRAEFEGLLEERLVGAEEFSSLGEAAHQQAEEADALLLLLAHCKASRALIQKVKDLFDTLRSLEEEIMEAAEWAKGMGRRLAVL